MAPYSRLPRSFAQSVDSSAQIDAGLRAYMSRVYGLMSAAMALTGIVAYGVSTSPELLQLIYATPLKWVVMFAPLALVFFLSARVHTLQPGTAQIVFWIYSALTGASISYIFIAYTGTSIARTFFVTAIAFLGLSIIGYTTKRNLNMMGAFLVMGLIGLIVASLLNIFIAAPGLSFAISVLGILIFAGLTAFYTQRIKNMYLVQRNADAATLERSAIMGALSLYLAFLNMFLFMLRFMGTRQ